MEENFTTNPMCNLFRIIAERNGIEKCIIFNHQARTLALIAALEHTKEDVYESPNPVPLYVMTVGERNPRYVGYVNIDGKPCLILSKPMNQFKIAKVTDADEIIEWDGKRTINIADKRYTKDDGFNFPLLDFNLSLLTDKGIIGDESIWYKKAI